VIGAIASAEPTAKADDPSHYERRLSCEAERDYCSGGRMVTPAGRDSTLEDPEVGHPARGLLHEERAVPFRTLASEPLPTVRLVMSEGRTSDSQQPAYAEQGKF
jgi:hypothetical protein